MRSARGSIFDRNGYIIASDTINYVGSSSEYDNDFYKCNFLNHYKRVYLWDSISASLIGATKPANNGLEGIEFKYDSVLSGKEMNVLFHRDGIGHSFINDTRNIFPRSGKSINLTLDMFLSNEIQKYISELKSSYSFRNIFVLLIKINNGQIYVCVNSPSYSPYNIRNYSYREILNPAVRSVLIPGPLFDILFYICNGIINIDELDSLNGLSRESSLKIINSTFNTKKKLITKLNFNQYLKSCGFGKLNGYDIPSECIGFVPSDNFYHLILNNKLPIGDFVICTPLQLSVLYAKAILNVDLTPNLIIDTNLNKDRITNKINSKFINLSCLEFNGPTEYGTNELKELLFARSYIRQVDSINIRLQIGWFTITEGDMLLVTGFITDDNAINCYNVNFWEQIKSTIINHYYNNNQLPKANCDKFKYNDSIINAIQFEYDSIVKTFN